MIIQKVINNNVVSTFDSNGKEVILMGKGIGFRKKTGDELDKTKIEKIFTLDLSGKSSFVQEVMAIIQEFYEIVLDTEHPAYQRFATHLQYLETEILSKKRPIEEDEEDDDTPISREYVTIHTDHSHAAEAGEGNESFENEKENDVPEEDTPEKETEETEAPEETAPAEEEVPAENTPAEEAEETSSEEEEA